MKPPLRVLYVHHASSLGGAEQSLIDMISGMCREAVQPILALPEDGPLAERLFRLGVEIYFTPMRRLTRTCNPVRLAGYAVSILSGSRALAGIAAVHDARVIHANSIYSALYAAPAAKIAGRRSVCHLRDMPAMKGLTRCLLSAFDVVVPISEAVARFYGLPADTVIPSGIDFARFDEPADGLRLRAEAGIPRDGLVVGAASRLVPWKNHADLVRAASAILPEVREAYFVVAGSDIFGDHPSYMNELVLLARDLGVQDRLRFVGWRDDMSEFYAALDVLVHPAMSEPFGRVLVEAMGCGVPVVAYDSAGPSEIVRDGRTGLLAPAGDWQALASKTISVLKDGSLRSSLGAAARKDVRSRFPADMIAYRVMKAYGLQI